MENNDNDSSAASFNYDPSVLAHIKQAQIINVALIGWVGSGKSTFLRYAEIKAALRTKTWDVFSVTSDDVLRLGRGMQRSGDGEFPNPTRGDEKFHHFYLCRPQKQGFFWGPKPRILHFLDIAGGLFDPTSGIFELQDFQPSDIYQDYINICQAIIIFFDSYRIRSDENYLPAFTRILRTITEYLQVGRSTPPKVSFFCMTKMDIFPFYLWDTIPKFKKLRNEQLGLDGERSSDLGLILNRYKRQWDASTWWAVSSIGYLDEAKTISRWDEENDKIIEPFNAEPIGIASLLEELLYRTR